MPFPATNDLRSSAIHREPLHTLSHEQSHGHGHGHGHGHAGNSIIVEDGDFPHAPALTADENAWYYPSHGYGSSDDDEDDDEGAGGGLDEDYYAGEVDGDVLFSSPSAHGASDVRRNGGVVARGNWGNKHTKRARWARRGKIAAWGPGMEDWQAEERARKRLKLLLPPNNNTASRRSPSPSSPPTPTLPHLRSPSPPLEAPYAQPAIQHGSYVSFVLDKSTTHTFRSRQLLELENATTALIEGEALLRGALGRLWQVLNDDPDRQVYVGAMASVGLGLGLGLAPGGGDGGLDGAGNGGPGAYVNGGMYAPPAPGAGGAVVPKREEEEEHHHHHQQQQQQQQPSQSQQQESSEEQQQQQPQAPPPQQQQQPIVISEDQPMLDLQEPDDEVARRLARAPDLTPTVHKLFLSFPTSLTTTAAPTVPGIAGNSINITTGAPGASSSSSTTANTNGTGGGATGSSNNTSSLAVLEPSQFAPPEGQLERLEKALATLRELQDDGREYVERLEEIREGLSAVRAQRDVIWRVVRETAIKELQEESGMIVRG